MSPEAFMAAGADRSDEREVVERFYAAVNAKDTATIEWLIDENFAPDVAVTWPDSLPYGGTITGADKLKRMFTAAAASEAPVGAVNVAVERVVEAILDGEDQLVVELSFDFYAPGGTGDPVRSGAAEWWTFRDLRVVALKAFYWDTAALGGG